MTSVVEYSAFIEKIPAAENIIWRGIIMTIVAFILMLLLVYVVFWGFIGKKFSAKSIVIICIILGGLNPLIAIVSALTNPLLYSLVFFILGFTISGRKVGFEPYLLEITPSNERIEYLGIRGSLNLMIVILPLLGAFFIEYFGYYFTFSLVTIVMLFSARLFSKAKDENILNNI